MLVKHIVILSFGKVLGKLVIDRNKAPALSFHIFKCMQTVKHNVTLPNSILRLPTAALPIVLASLCVFLTPGIDSNTSFHEVTQTPFLLRDCRCK